jgi:hypothetical protein
MAALVSAAVCAGGMAAAQAHEDNNRERGSYGFMQWGNLDAHINHLNRMVGHVRWQLTRYHPGGDIRREFADIRRDVDRANWKFRQGHYDRRQLRREVDNLHERLHRLEVRMHVRANDYYNWR